MTQVEMFGNARWIGAEPGNDAKSILIRKSFTAKAKSDATLSLIGLGTFEIFINGKRVSDEYFLPLNSEYEDIDCPKGEKLGHRIYATKYSVGEYLLDGENTLAVLLGFGWYTGIELWDEPQKVYGNKKLIYSLDILSAEGERQTVISDGDELYTDAFVLGGHLHIGETHDYRGWRREFLENGCDLKDFKAVSFEKPVNSEYCYTGCPADKIHELVMPIIVYECDEYKIYDAGRNTTGYPIITVDKDEYSEVNIIFSERLDDSRRELDSLHIHKQAFSAIANRGAGDIHPHFTWYAYRFFKVVGDATVKCCAVIHSDIKVNSYFESSSPVLNWIYNTFIDTQLANMHRGIPSDCPHIERLGYTGDGQNTCRSVFHTLDVRDFYRKWIMDIADSQDRLTGHVQNTAPYILAGGGPGGWGCAIVTVPYEFWKYYGDTALVAELFPFMLRYLDFLNDHSEFYLVTSDHENTKWCLGDWCTPPDQSNIPAPFVNTYFHIRSIQRVLEIAEAIGRSAEVEYLIERLDKCKWAIDKFYLNSLYRDMTYVGNTSGASAFAINAGLGNSTTAEKLASYYDRLGYYDTGIFGTELVTRTLFDMGRADIAYRLLTADEPHGFGKWRKNGETSFPEYWGTSRSHNHPMFGAVVACLFEYILGIKQEGDSVGYEKIIISPVKIDELSYAKGYITTPKGKIFVSYERVGDTTEYKLEVPSGTTARLTIDGAPDVLLSPGTHTFKV